MHGKVQPSCAFLQLVRLWDAPRSPPLNNRGPVSSVHSWQPHGGGACSMQFFLSPSSQLIHVMDNFTINTSERRRGKSPRLSTSSIGERSSGRLNAYLTSEPRQGKSPRLSTSSIGERSSRRLNAYLTSEPRRGKSPRLSTSSIGERSSRRLNA